MAGPTSRSSATASLPLSQRRAPRARLECRVASTPEERAAHFRIRHQVFVIEQGLFGASGTDRAGVSARAGGDDRDSHDDDPATLHVIGLADGVMCGAVRLYPLPGRTGRWKGDRLAVLPGQRRYGLGAPLVRFAVTTAALRGGVEMEAYIQPANITFFGWLGWRRAGGLVDYAGVPHQRMLIDVRAGQAVPGDRTAPDS